MKQILKMKKHWKKDWKQLYNCTIAKKNPVLLYASDLLQIHHSTSKGNHLKAVKTIEPSDVIINEPPYASVLINKFISTHCYECMKRLDSKKMNISYCTKCTHVAYCSETCCATSFDNSHKYECKLLKLLVFNVGLTHMEHLALRIVMKAGFKYLKSIKSSLVNYENEYYTEDYKIKSDEKYDSLDYMNIFRLITHAKDREASDLFRRTFIATFLTRFLEKNLFFENSENINEDRSFIGGLILRHMQSISCNAHEINELRTKRSMITMELFMQYANLMNVGQNYKINTSLSVNVKHVKKIGPCMTQSITIWIVLKLDVTLVKQSWTNTVLLVRARTIILRKQKPTWTTQMHFHSALRKFLDFKENEKHFSNFCVCFINYLKLMDRFILTRPYKDYNSCQEAVKQCFNIMSENKHEI